MASIIIRDIDEPVTARLRDQAAAHGRSMEDEAREILRAALSWRPEPPTGLANAIRARFQVLGGVEMPDVERDPIREAPSFGS